MKLKSLLFLFFLSVLVITGCSNKQEFIVEKDTLTVEKRVGDEAKYDDYQEVTVSNQVTAAFEVLHKTKWENAEVSMVRPPDYKVNNIYAVWVSPNGDQLEIVIEGKSKYAQLPKADSSEFFKIITGEELKK